MLHISGFDEDCSSTSVHIFSTLTFAFASTVAVVGIPYADTGRLHMYSCYRCSRAGHVPYLFCMS